MKKLLLFAALFLSMATFAQTDLFFSEYVEGSGNNKGLEIYNPTDETIDLTKYIVVRFSNGEAYPANLDPKTTSGGYLELVGTLAPGECHVIVNGQTEDNEFSPACDPAMQALADQLDNDYPAPTYMNGNDAIGLLKTEDGVGYAAVDIFGEMGLGSTIKDAYGWSYVKDSTLTYTANDVEVTATISNYIVQEIADDGTSFGPFWMAWSKDHTLIRKPNVLQGVTSNPSPFNISDQWDTIPSVNVGDTAWTQKDVWSNLGTHKINSGVSVNKKKNNAVNLFPNPIQNNSFNIISEFEIISISVYNAIGQNIYEEKMNPTKSHQVLLDNPKKGIYMLRVSNVNNNTIVKKLIVD